MGHYAKIQNGIVTRVIVADADFFKDYVDNSPGLWLKTSYNTFGGVHYGQDGLPDGKEALRKNYAGIGYTYDQIRDAFIPPKPYESWVLNEASCLWNPPIPQPNDGKPYIWNESIKNWEELVVPAPKTTPDNQ